MNKTKHFTYKEGRRSATTDDYCVQSVNVTTRSGNWIFYWFIFWLIAAPPIFRNCFPLAQCQTNMTQLKSLKVWKTNICMTALKKQGSALTWQGSFVLVPTATIRNTVGWSTETDAHAAADSLLCKQTSLLCCHPLTFFYLTWLILSDLKWRTTPSGFIAQHVIFRGIRDWYGQWAKRRHTLGKDTCMLSVHLFICLFRSRWVFICLFDCTARDNVQAIMFTWNGNKMIWILESLSLAHWKVFKYVCGIKKKNTCWISCIILVTSEQI